MTLPIDPKRFSPSKRPSLFVLVDMQREMTDDTFDAALGDTIARCREALDHARASHVPIAFVRRLRGAALPPRPWLSGFMPSRYDMLFERHGNTCYASEPFGERVEAAGRDYVLAGLFGETSCIATVIDAANRGHRVTFLADASCSHGRGGLSPADMHRALTSVIDLHAFVETTRAWTLRVRQANGGDYQ